MACATGCHKAPKIYNINVSASPVAGGVVVGNGNYEEGQSCTVTATANDGFWFVNWTENGNSVSTNPSYIFNVTDNRNLVACFMRDCEYVDLGLPSGMLWATYNIGANVPEDYGDYFAWGETETKDIYNWSTYKWCNDYYDRITKYCSNSGYGDNGFTDNLTMLLSEDDAATANWGGNWRMPTRMEWKELLDNTTNTWTPQNGVDGWLFTATNGASLFLPAAGYRCGNSFYYVTNGYYWSSSLHQDYSDYSWSLFFYLGNCGVNHQGHRFYGLTVRAVRSASKN